MDNRSIEPEMITPYLCARRIEGSEGVSLEIKRRDIAALGTVALEAGIGQVLANRRATMFDRDDVIGFVGV